MHPNALHDQANARTFRNENPCDPKAAAMAEAVTQRMIYRLTEQKNAAYATGFWIGMGLGVFFGLLSFQFVVWLGIGK